MLIPYNNTPTHHVGVFVYLARNYTQHARWPGSLAAIRESMQILQFYTPWNPSRLRHRDMMVRPRSMQDPRP